MTEKMREEFERTSVRDTRRQPPKGNNYIDPLAQMDWLAFQKGWGQSREALVIEWPDQHTYTSPDVAGAAILDCMTAYSKAKGLKVTP